VSLPEKVLVANRGEIAVRIIRTLTRMGIASVAVYHALDARSPAMLAADEAVELFGETPVGAYLDVEAIVAAAERTGAQALHPGFGFLSENPSLAEAVAAAGIIWIGPPPAAMRLMGDKVTSKQLARQAGVPTLPGTDGAVESADAAVAAAAGIGYPVLVKASAGGGGKGMRIAHDPEGLRDGFARASAEAAASFGDGRVFVERFVERPRHIEIQVLADAHGTVLHLGERECSIQRRYQKVIEECPSPFVDETMRAAMGQTAVALARAVDYRSAGTVEMIADADGGFYFLEMNTRLQVEHPVTELVTGVDIVAEQVRIAAGEPLAMTQDDVQMRGHAIECRVYAEDAEAGFIPATGRLALVRFPTGEGIRVDSGVLEGGEISSAFDPMIAKVCAHAPTRDHAIRRERAALRETVLLGATTNTAFLERVLAQPEFERGETHTGFIDEHSAVLTSASAAHEDELALVGAAALASPRFDPRWAAPEPLASIGPWIS
jgi:acetyl-CoA carboxylase biotin carboxylase subunit